MRIRLLLVVATLLVSATAMAEQFYKWKDDKGVWHYTSTKPPAGTQAEEVAVKEGTPESIAAAPTGTNASANSDTAAKPAAGSTEEIQARRKATCTQAQDTIKTLETYAVVKMDLDNSGEAKPLTAEQHAQQLANAREVEAIACGG